MRLILHLRHFFVAEQLILFSNKRHPTNLLMSPELLHLLSHHLDELDHDLVVLVGARVEQLVDAHLHDVVRQHPRLEQLSDELDVSGHPLPEGLHHRLALHLDLLLLFLV